MGETTATEVRPRKRARLKALMTVAGWHCLGAAVVTLELGASVGQCRGKCGVDEHAFDGLIFFGQMAALVVFGLVAAAVALVVTSRWRSHPILIGTVVSAGALFIMGADFLHAARVS